MYWSWLKSGVALGFCFLITVVLVKPIGVSTQFVILDGIIGSTFSRDLVVKDDTVKSGFKSSNPYLNKSSGKYAKAVANPLNYSFVFVLAMVAGGLLGRLSHRRSGGEIRQVPVENVFDLNGAPQKWPSSGSPRSWSTTRSESSTIRGSWPISSGGPISCSSSP